MAIGLCDIDRNFQRISMATIPKDEQGKLHGNAG